MKKIFLITVVGLCFGCCKNNQKKYKKIIIITHEFNRHGMNRCDAG